MYRKTIWLGNVKVAKSSSIVKHPHVGEYVFLSEYVFFEWVLLLSIHPVCLQYLSLNHFRYQILCLFADGGWPVCGFDICLIRLGGMEEIKGGARGRSSLAYITASHSWECGAVAKFVKLSKWTYMYNTHTGIGTYCFLILSLSVLLFSFSELCLFSRTLTWLTTHGWQHKNNKLTEFSNMINVKSSSCIQSLDLSEQILLLKEQIND